jgi:hypothetical protein
MQTANIASLPFTATGMPASSPLCLIGSVIKLQ